MLALHAPRGGSLMSGRACGKRSARGLGMVRGCDRLVAWGAPSKAAARDLIRTSGPAIAPLFAWVLQVAERRQESSGLPGTVPASSTGWGTMTRSLLFSIAMSPLPTISHGAKSIEKSPPDELIVPMPSPHGYNKNRHFEVQNLLNGTGAGSRVRSWRAALPAIGIPEKTMIKAIRLREQPALVSPKSPPTAGTVVYCECRAQPAAAMPCR